MSIKEEFEVIRLRRAETYKKALEDYTHGKNNYDFRLWFNNKEHRISEDYLSYKLVNDWVKAGVIEDDRDNKKGWRLYSIMDIIWIFSALQLRFFGLPLNKIANIRKERFFSIGQCKYGELEYYTQLAFFKKNPVSILYFANDLAEICTGEEFSFNEIEPGISSHIRININMLLQDMFNTMTIKPKFQNFSEKEKKVIEAIRDPKILKVEVTKKDGKPLLIGKTEQLEEDINIKKLARKSNFNKVVVSTNYGKTENPEYSKIEKL